MEEEACFVGCEWGGWLKHFIRFRIHFITCLRANPKTILKVGKQELINFTSSPQCLLMSFLALINPVIFPPTTVNNTSHTAPRVKHGLCENCIWLPVALTRLSNKQILRLRVLGKRHQTEETVPLLLTCTIMNIQLCKHAAAGLKAAGHEQQQ